MRTLPLTINTPVMGEFLFGQLLAILQGSRFIELDLGDITIHVADVDMLFSDWLLNEIEFELKTKVKPLAIFARRNSSEEDTSFRIHSDGEICGQRPDLAFVYYLKGTSGTALFKHEEHGDFSLSAKIFTEDDPKWEMTVYNHPTPDSMFIYDARSFHSRWPCKEEGERIVVVGFLKIEEN